MARSLQQLLFEHQAKDLLAESDNDYPVILARQSDETGRVLERLSEAGLESTLVLSSTVDAALAANEDGLQASFPALRAKGLKLSQIVGFVDLNLILQHLLRGAFESTVLHHNEDEFERIADAFCRKPVGELLKDVSFHGHMSNEWALHTEETASLYAVIRECFLFTKPGSMRPPKSPGKSIHHVAIHSAVPEGGEVSDAAITGILSQTDVIRFLHRHTCKAAPSQGVHVLHRPIRDLGLVGYAAAEVPPSPSTTSSENSEFRTKAALGARMTLAPAALSALEALRRMCMHRDSGVGVLAPDGTLSRFLSATDLRRVALGRFRALLMPVTDFFEQQPLATARGPSPLGVPARSFTADSADARKRSLGGSDGGAGARPASKRVRPLETRTCVLTCQATSTLAEVLAIMASHGVHTVFAVDPDSKPLSAVTVADVLRVAADAASGAAGRPDPRIATPVATASEAAFTARSSRVESVSGASDVGASDRAPSVSQAQSVCTSGQSEPRIASSADLRAMRPP